MAYMLTNWTVKNKAHIITWLLFIVYETLAVGLAFNSWANPITYIIHYAITVYLFYLYAEKLFPFAFGRKFNVIVLVPLVALIQLTLYIVLHYLADKFLIFSGFIKTDKPYPLDKVFLIKNAYRGFFFMGFSTGYYFLKTYLQERKRTTDLEKAQLNAIIKQKNTEQELFKAQNAFLKAQINPHFLFNTLHFIHTKVSVSSPEAAEAVIALSEMMRYALGSDEQGGTIILEDEMEQVINLISLFKLRKSSPLYLKAEFEENTKQLPFIPLILLTLAENMFKHGQLHDANHQAILKVYIESDMLIFETRNLSHPQKSNREHTGLANIKQRLIYAYGESVHFEYGTDAEEFFTLKLGVLLAQLSEPAL